MEKTTNLEIKLMNFQLIIWHYEYYNEVCINVDIDRKFNKLYKKMKNEIKETGYKPAYCMIDKLGNVSKRAYLGAKLYLEEYRKLKELEIILEGIKDE